MGSNFMIDHSYTIANPKLTRPYTTYFKVETKGLTTDPSSWSNRALPLLRLP